MRKLFFGFMAIICNVGFSEIIPIRSLKEADLSGLSSESLVLFDVDEVLVSSEDVILTPAGGDFLAQISDAQTSIMLQGTEYALVEKDAPLYIKNLQDLGIPTIAFTACWTGSLGVLESMENWRFNQLKVRGIDFSENKFQEVSFPHLASPNPPKFDRGILYCGDFYHREKSTKGELLGVFLDEMNEKPTEVVFFDDGIKNLVAVERELEKRGIPFKGYHFQKETSPLNKKTAELQVKNVVEKNRWISDREVAALRAVVFDFGGVMTTAADRKTIVQFLSDSFGLNPPEFERVNEVKRKALKLGITDEEFWISYALEQGIDLPSDWASNFKSVLKNALGANPKMFQLVEDLKAKKIPVALLSNIDDRLAKLVREFGYYDAFEPCLLSCEIEIKKPDLKAYEYLIEKVGVPAAQIVFIDDLEENIKAAQSAGLDAIRFESFEQISKELCDRGFL